MIRFLNLFRGVVSINMGKRVGRYVAVAGYVAIGAVVVFIPFGATTYAAYLANQYRKNKAASEPKSRDSESELKDLADNMDRAEWGRFLSLFE